MKKLIHRFIKRNGYQVKPYPDTDIMRRMKLVNYYKIDTIIDVGASIGQYGRSMREIGYKNRIISFEPLKSSFEILKEVTGNDINWVVNNFALGSENTKGVINLAMNSVSSSLLNMLPLHVNSEPGSQYISKEEIEIKRLDSVFNSFCCNDNNVMLKIVTQGYEKEVIEGAGKALGNIKIIHLEMSIFPLYETEMLFMDKIKYLDNKGFKLFSLENGFYNRTTGQLLQVHGIFENCNI